MGVKLVDVEGDVIRWFVEFVDAVRGTVFGCVDCVVALRGVGVVVV